MPMQPGVSDRDVMMEQMLAQPMPEQEEANDPKALIDMAIERVMAYSQNPEQVTPETVQELLEMLQQASAALGGEDAEEQPVGLGNV